MLKGLFGQRFVGLALLLIICSPAFAWDFDFHFHVTYLICRDLGMSHEICFKMAAPSAEWTDQSLISGPFLFSKPRELNHFNGFFGEFMDGAGGGELLNLFRRHATVSHAESPVANAFFTRALRDHDLISAFMHVHTLQDLLAHAGFYARVGHPDEGRWPDRYWLPDSDYEMLKKFRGSVLKTYYALYAIRQLLPPEMLDLDHGLVFSADRRREDLDSPALLAQRFVSNLDVKKLTSTDFLRHPEYVANGLAWFFECFKKQGIVNDNIDYTALIPPGVKIDGTVSVQDVLVKILSVGQFMRDNNGTLIFDMQKLMARIFKSYSSFESLESDFVTQEMAKLKADPQQNLAAVNPEALKNLAIEGAHLRIADAIVTVLGKGFVPTPLGKRDYVDMFEEPALRNKEMALRQNAWNDIIEKYTGHRIAFQAKLLRNSGVIGSVFRSIPGFHPDLFAHRHEHNDLSDPKLEVVTVPLEWRLKWIQRQSRILFTTMGRIHSAEYLQGANDYMDPQKFGALIASSQIRPFTLAEVQRLMGSHDAPMQDAMLSLHRLVRQTGKGVPKSMDPSICSALLGGDDGDGGDTNSVTAH